MTTPSRTVSLLLARTACGALILTLASFGLWAAGDLRGQAPDKPGAAPPKKQRTEEEEDTPKAPPPKKKRAEEEEEEAPKKPPKRKVIRVEEEEDTKPKPGPAQPSAPPVGGLAQLVRQSRHPGVRQLFRDLAVPHDRVVFKSFKKDTPPHEETVEPIPTYLGSDPTKFRGTLVLHLLDSEWKPIKTPHRPTLTSIEYVEPYESIAQRMVRDFLKEPFDGLPPQNTRHLSRFDMLAAAEQALSAVLRWHESARQTDKRDGSPEWESIETKLRKQLLDEVWLPQLQILSDARDWDRVLGLTRRLAQLYPNKTDRERIAKPVATMLDSVLKDATSSDETKQEARKRLHQLEDEFPDSKVLQPIGAELRKRAEDLLNRARALGKEGRERDDKERVLRAKALVREAKEFWPQTPGLHALEIDLDATHPVLRVGVRGRLPQYLSPAWACTDTERRVVEMLFESLVQITPDEDGIFRYRPGLAEYRPKVLPLARQFQLPREAMWCNIPPNSKPMQVNAGDIRFTVQALKDGVGTGRSLAWGQLFHPDRAVEVRGDPFQVTVRLNQGFLDPLALMTFKVLPRDLPVNSKDFAKKPTSSGPFFLDDTRHSDEERRECMFFVANPSYGIRPSKRDLPRIQEIRLYLCADPVSDLRNGRLDLVLDLTAKEAADLIQKSSEFRVTVPLPSTTTPNRRIYFLAINQQKLPDLALRKALAYAINREALLDKHFRGPLQKQVHKALNGPFPVGSWAANPASTDRTDKGAAGLFDAEKAQALSKDPAVQKAIHGGPLKLKYPEGDPVLAKALEDLAEQVKAATGLTLELVPCDPHQLRQDVEQSQTYDLAYYHYDFPDETYWLWPLLGPYGLHGKIDPSIPDSNFLNFADDKLQSLLREASGYRDFAKVREYQQKVHENLMKLSMPFIPLWQLDPLLAIHRDVTPAGLDPALVFTNIAEWRLNRK